ncbi:MAG: GNAT family N-acetyltransferase [Clostridia bacterium]|nr:GNAT family N-acetyltransferase [Clostridia bacterium]
MKKDNVKIRAAEERDIPGIGKLLEGICDLHADGSPDLFNHGGRKYSDGELAELLRDETRPIWVAEADGDLLGYAFCIIKSTSGEGALKACRTLYIDDLCVDPVSRGMGVGRRLFEFCRDKARDMGCHNLTLNVWAFNGSAIEFYEKMGMKVQSMHMETVLTDKGEE